MALWFDAAHSPLNPRQQSGFYVYGEAPMLIMVLAAYFVDRLRFKLGRQGLEVRRSRHHVVAKKSLGRHFFCLTRSFLFLKG